jgi:hypothetical protein
MRTQRMILRLMVAGGLCAVAAPAFSQGTPEQQMACTPDVWRLCGAEIPDVDRIVACLRQNRPQLSEACRAVFASDEVTPRRESRREQRTARQQRALRDRGEQRRRYQDGEAAQPRRYEEDPRQPRRYDEDNE